MLSLSLDRMRTDDLDEVIEIERASFSMPWSRGAFLYELQQNRVARCLVMREGTHVVGYLCLWEIGDELHITNVAVHPDQRRRGIGRSLLTGVLDFGGEDAESVMVPVEQMVTVPRSATIAAIEEVVVRTGHSRLPVTVGGGEAGDDAGVGEVVGFVHSKDLLAAADSGGDEQLPASMIRRLLIVPRRRSMEDLLLSMRFSRVHLAVVSDEQGRTVGLVTLEELLEELVGEILDESDEPPASTQTSHEGETTDAS